MRKLGKATDMRLALLQNQVSNLLWKGKIETTFARAKEVQKLAEKYITIAMNTHADTVNVEKTRFVKGKPTTVSVVNDGAKKLAARRFLMANLNDLQEQKGKEETDMEYKVRTGDIKHPLIEKVFNVYAPKYQARAKEAGQGGGYTAIYKLGVRRGDAAEMAIISLI